MVQAKYRLLRLERTDRTAQLDILERLRSELPSLPKKLALAARHALDAPDRIALNSMRATASEVGVTSTTMFRLARQLGFDSYEDFRASFQEQLVTTGFGARAGALHRQRAIEADDTLAGRIEAACHENLAQALHPANLKWLSHVAQLMRNAPAVYLVGSGSLFWLANIVKTTGSMVLPSLRIIGTEHVVAAEGMGELCADDVVICFGISPCAARTIDAISFAAQQGSTTVAMTDRPSSPLVQHATYSFFAPTQSPHYYPSIASMIILVEALLATVVAEGGVTELEGIETFEARRKTSTSYLEY